MRGSHAALVIAIAALVGACRRSDPPTRTLPNNAALAAPPPVDAGAPDPVATLRIRFFVEDPSSHWIGDGGIIGLHPGEHYRILDDWNLALRVGERFDRLAPNGKRVVFTLRYSEDVGYMVDGGTYVRHVVLSDDRGADVACNRQGIALNWWQDDVLMVIDCDASLLPMIPMDLGN